jgi:hypothetical protein
MLCPQESGTRNPNVPKNDHAPENSNIHDPDDVPEDVSKKAPGRGIHGDEEENMDRDEGGSQKIERRRAS